MGQSETCLGILCRGSRDDGILVVGRGRGVCPSPDAAGGQGPAGKKAPRHRTLRRGSGSRAPEVGIPEDLPTLQADINTPFLLKPLEDWLSTTRVKRVLTHQVPNLVPLCGLASLNSAQPRWSPFLDAPGEFSSGAFTHSPLCLQIVPIT